MLESQQLLLTFKIIDPFATVEVHKPLAIASSFKDSQEPSADEYGKSFYTIGRDFDNWLAPKGCYLIWSKNSLSSSGDNLYPAAIAPSDILGAIDLRLISVGGYLMFSYTSKW